MYIIVKIVNRRVVFSLIEEFSAFAEKRQFGENKEVAFFPHLGLLSVSGPREYLRRCASETGYRIEVDLNFLFRMPIAGTEVRELWQPGELDRPSVRVAGLGEILIGKLLALLDRGAVRDAWDVAYPPSTTKVDFASPFHYILAKLPPKQLRHLS
jgi:hypothetical protein